MSKEFIQFRFPCVDCIVRAACQDKPEKMPELYDEQNPILLAMPKIDDNNKYLKMFLECWANIGFDAVDKIRNVKDTNSIPEKYANFLIENINLLQWIVNSTSWREGEKVMNFDKYEIRHKLRVLRRWLK